MMKKHPRDQPAGFGYRGGNGAAPAPSYGYSQAPSTLGNHLPNIGHGTALRLPFGQFGTRPASGLQLDITALPNMGFNHPSTVPRERPQTQAQARLHRHSSSESSAIDKLREVSRDNTTHRGMYGRRFSTDDRLMVSKHAPRPIGNTTPDSSSKIRGGLAPLNRPPSSYEKEGGPTSRKIYSTLPPIGSENVRPTQATEIESADGHDRISESESGSLSSSELEDELFSDDASEAPPSRPGFESDAEKSAQMFSVPFPEVNVSTPFPATIIQDHAQLEMDRFSVNAQPSGISPRVDNIVRAFCIHGPLDKQLLSKALNEVASLHPLLTATFQRSGDRLYVQTTNTNKVTVNIESPVVGHEQPQDLVINARRKLFPLTMRTDMVHKTDQQEEITNVISLVSVLGSEASDKSPVQATQQYLQKRVTFVQLKDNITLKTNDNSVGQSQLPPLQHESHSDEHSPLLMRARLVSRNSQTHHLVLSFPRIICDFWSSCLFMQQVADAYSKLEKNAMYRPSLASKRIENKRQAVMNAYDRTRGTSTKRDAATRLMQKRAQGMASKAESSYKPMCPARLHFQQVAQRESQLLLMLPRERLWGFWESMVTATIRRQRGPNRIKVVPPVRIPSGLGDKKTTTVSRGRPGTSRFRPLTASRNRPQTARRQGGGGVFGDTGTSREALMGPKTLFQYVKVEEAICAAFKISLPEEYQSYIRKEEQLSLMCFSAYVLMLGRCCRGWGVEKGVPRRNPLHNDSNSESQRPSQKPLKLSDPLHLNKGMVDETPTGTVTIPGSRPLQGRTRQEKMRPGLDLGSFLIGVEISLRDSEPNMTQGLFGPLSNDTGIRVNLSSCETFADLVVSLGNSLRSARNHSHYPFGTVAEEVGLIHGLPIKFSFLHHHDIIQLTNPNDFYFTEAAVGVEGHGLARLGSSCYLTPLNSKMDDNCYFELLLWEGYEAECVAGGIRYQPHVIRTELVEAFVTEMCRLLAIVAEDPSQPLVELAQEIQPPFIHSRTKSRTHRKF